MLARAREKGVDAVVFFGEKFCASEALDYPYLRRRLERNGMRTLFLASAADQGQHLENCRTRIDAFAEMMGTPG
jgi:benzoyl-CoA reductase/2-hydroxyglutaryl-CoA dehydratase subunit BcrC/BadD/HgdB